MKWFLTGVWVTLIVGLYIWQMLIKNIDGIGVATILIVLTAIVIGWVLGYRDKENEKGETA